MGVNAGVETKTSGPSRRRERQCCQTDSPTTVLDELTGKLSLEKVVAPIAGAKLHRLEEREIGKQLAGMLTNITIISCFFSFSFLFISYLFFLFLHFTSLGEKLFYQEYISPDV